MIGSVYIGPAVAVCVGLALAAWIGPGSRTRLTLAWISMVGFAGLASYSFWRGYELRRSGAPAFIELPGVPGDQRVTIPRAGIAPGYRLQLVNRQGQNLEREAALKVSACNWTITTCEHLEYRIQRPFETESFFDFESECPDIVLRYTVPVGAGPLLADVMIKTGCPPGFRKVIEQGWSSARFFAAMFMGGLFFAAFGARAQRRKLRAPQPPALTSPS